MFFHCCVVCYTSHTRDKFTNLFFLVQLMASITTHYYIYVLFGEKGCVGIVVVEDHNLGKLLVVFLLVFGGVGSVYG